MTGKTNQTDLQIKDKHDVLLTVLDSIDATIYVSSMETHEILYMNKFMKGQFGEDLEGKICHMAFRKSKNPCFNCTSNIILNNGVSTGVYIWEAENPLIKKWFRNYDRAIKWVDGTWARLQIATDITTSKETENKLHQLHDELEALVQERTNKYVKANTKLKTEITEHNKAKQALVESERLLNKAQEFSKTGNFRFDFKSNQLSWSDQYYRILGLPPGKPKKPTHKTFLSRIHPEDREKVNQMLAFDQGFKSNNCDFIFKTVPIDGIIHTVRAFSEVEFDETGVPLFMQGINQDITDQVKAQENLKKSESMYRTLVNNISEGLIITDQDFKIIFVNPRFSEITGYKEVEIINRSTELLFEGDDLNKIKKFFLQNLKGSSGSLELMVTQKKKEHTLMIVSGNPIMDNGVFSGIFLVMTNISHVRKAEQQLYESVRYLNRAQKISNTGSWNWDVATGKSEWSDEMYCILGYKPQIPKKITSDVFFRKVHPGDREICKYKLKRGIEKGVPFEFEYRTVPINSLIKTIRCFVEMDLDEQGKPIRMIGIDQDFTSYRRNEIALKIAKSQAEASNAAKTTFLSNMSHELRTPMQGILGFTKLCITKLNSLNNDKIKEYLDDIYSSAQRLMSLLNDLLDLSKLESGNNQYEFRPDHINNIIHRNIASLRLLAEDKGLHVHYDSEEFTGSIEMDTEKINLVINHLLSNAIKYSSPNNDIIIDITDQNEFVHFSISNQGVEIPAKELESIFDKFAQSSNTNTGAGGKGLGLAISKQIIFDHSGEIWAENKSNHSVTFNFQIPKLQK